MGRTLVDLGGKFPWQVMITAQRVDITLSDGRRILVEGPTALSSIMAMVAAVAQ